MPIIIEMQNIDQVNRIPLDISIRIIDAEWEGIYLIPQYTTLEKGRRNDVYREIISKASQFQNQFGCYAWGTSVNKYYIGSFSRDHKSGKYKSNLQGRVHNYLQNHGRTDSNRQNTNLMVFNNLNTTLASSEVDLFVYKFNFLIIGEQKIEYSEFCRDGQLVRAVEQLLIYIYKRNHQCEWNRE